VSSEFRPRQLSRRTPDQAIAAIARRQHGVVSIRQLHRAGLDNAAVSRRVRGGRLHRVGRGVYGVGHASLSREAQWMAAVLEAGAGAALSHLAAASLWQAWRRRVDQIDVVSPRRSSLPHVHWSRRLDPRDTTSAKLDRLERALELHVRGCAGTKSDLEDEFLARVAGPEPLVNTRVAGVEADFHWRHRKLCVEVDRPGHLRPRTQREDAARDRRLRAAGFEVVRISERPPARIRPSP
jgi:putative AbiEi antitoxin of type IV toxin-antitoxin system/uncharacterized protein DUF559